jgi:hypothetical protein
MALLRRFIVCVASLFTGCSTIPDLPREWEMPVQEIMLHATCELREAFISIASDPRYTNFHAKEWALNITLTPKVDTQLQSIFGYTGKSTTNPKILRFVTWTLGTNPGIRGEVDGHKDGAVTFPLRSKQLLDVKKYPLFGCEEIRLTAHALKQYLGIREWLERIVPENATGLGKITHVDKPSFSSQIVVKVDAGNAAVTFFVPPGSTFTPSLAALYKRDVTLSITLTPDPTKAFVQTYPDGAQIRKTAPSAERVSPAAQSRLDQIQLERAIQNLRVQVQ